MHGHLNNNTPVNTEVLWGGVVGCGGGLLRADRSELTQHDQYIIDVYNPIRVEVCRAVTGAPRDIAEHAISGIGATGIEATSICRRDTRAIDAASAKQDFDISVIAKPIAIGVCPLV